MSEIDIDIPDHQHALIKVYNSIKKNESFWRWWLELRTSALADLGMFPENEQVAASDLRASLQGLAEVVGEK